MTRNIAIALLTTVCLGAWSRPSAETATTETASTETAAGEGAADETTAEGEADADDPARRLEELDQKVRILERKAELAQEAADAGATTAVTATAGKDGFSLRTADGSFVLELRGYVQADGRFFDNDGERPAVDTFLLRRVRPILEGNAGSRFAFRIMTDFGSGTSSVQDAWLDVELWPALSVRAGKFKPPVGLERLQSGADLLFVERAHPTNLVPNRDVGVELHGDLTWSKLTWALGVFNGVPDGASGDLDVNDGKDVAARVFLYPIPALGIGMAASGGDQQGSVTSPALPVFRTPAQQTFFAYRSDGTAPNTVVADGDRRRLVPQALLHVGRLGIMAEYARSEQEVRRATTTAELTHDAWQAAVSFAVTDDRPSFRGVTPKEPLDPAAGAWGALEVKARYTKLEVDEDAFPLFADPAASARTATTVGGGLTWTLTRNVRAYLDYEVTSVEGGAAAGDRRDEHAVLSRLQISF